MFSVVPKEPSERKTSDFGKSGPVAASIHLGLVGDLGFALCIGLGAKSEAVGKI